jgi:N-acetylglucosaminyl-diphospho-decaprenol L-rhamnosyltransferase
VPASTQPLVDAGIVSWNTRELLLRCLRSLEPEHREGRARVWVVDNGSSDGSAEAARAAAPWATVLEPGANLGFGRAVNLVAQQGRSPWLLATNADVALGTGALEALLAAGGDNRVGCVAPRLELPDGATQHSVHPLPTVPFTLAFNLGLCRLSRHLGDRLCLEGLWDPERRRAVPWAIGACLLIRRAAFDEVGGFDEQQWMYAEDLDFGWRLREHGWTTYYEPAARVLHESGAAAAQMFGEDQRADFMAATYAVLRRRRGRARAWATAALNLGGAAARLAWKAPAALIAQRWLGPKEDSRAWLAAHRSASRTLRNGGR